MMTEAFWMFFVTSMLGVVGGVLAILYKSKCSSFEFSPCGGLRFERNVNVELEEDRIAAAPAVPPADNV